MFYDMNSRRRLLSRRGFIAETPLNHGDIAAGFRDFYF